MKDTFKREIDYLRISVTDRCNLRCIYCMPEGIEKVTHADIMRHEEIINVVKEAVKVGIRKVRITGGEPLVRKGLLHLIQEIKAVPEIAELTLTTNGVLLLGNVKTYKDAGIDRINVSLDTLDANKYQMITGNKMIDYRQLLIELKDNQVPVKLNAVLMKEINDTEIPEFIELADEFDIVIRFIELMPVGKLDFDWKSHYLSNDVIINKYNLQKVSTDKNTDYYKANGYKGLIGFINPISKKFCSECNRIRVTSDGKIKPCLHNDSEIDIKDLKQELLLDKIKYAIKSKPEKHNLKKKRSKRSMNRIGG